MAITTSTAKIQFNVGSFDADTTLDVPSTTFEDKLTLMFPEFITSQISDVFEPSGADTGFVDILMNISFNGTETVYKNAQFDTDFSGDFNRPLEANRDYSVAVLGWDFMTQEATSEVVTINKLIDLITSSGGVVSNGTYSISLKYVYVTDGGLQTAQSVVTYSINFVFQEKKPIPSQTNDTFAEVLTLLDSQNYTINGVLADRQFEFILYPPEDRQVQEELLDNVQTFTFTTFWTGANEFRLYVLLTYQYTNHDIINLQTAYLPFTIFYLDKCAIYNCLKDLRDKLESSSCGIKLLQDRQNRLLNANVLATLLLTGQGCGTDVSEIAEEFATICGCGCSVADANPRQIGPDVS